MKTPLIIDIETDGQAPQVGRLLTVGYQLADADTATVVTFDGPSLEGVGELHHMLADPERPIVSHTKYDAKYLRMQGWEVTGPYYDTQVMAWVLNENQMLSLDLLARRYLGVEMDKRIKTRNKLPYFKCDDGTLVPLGEAPVDQLVAYNQRDVETTTRLFLELQQALVETAWWDYYVEEEVPFTDVLLDMECNGLPVNLSDTAVLAEKLADERDAGRAFLLRTGNLPPGFNVNSGDQLESYLYYPVLELADRLPIDAGLAGALKSIPRDERVDYVQSFAPSGFTVSKVGRLYYEGSWMLKGRNLPPTEKTPGGDRWSTSSPVLKSNAKAMKDEWVRHLLQYRKVEKLLTTYLLRFPELAQPSGGHFHQKTYLWEDGSHGHPNLLDEAELCTDLGCSATQPRLYGRFNQTGTKTGRLSSSEPNLQNIPSHGPLGEATRGLFQGDLVVGDYSQLEPRLMAHFSEDPLLLDIYRTGKDIYLETAKGIFKRSDLTKDSEERGIAKTLVLAMGYGAGPAKVAQILTVNGFPTETPTAKVYLRDLQALYATFFAWREAIIQGARQRGYVTTLAGRHRRLRAAFNDRRNFKNIGYGERQAVNAVVQGSAGDIVRRVMVKAKVEFPHLRLLGQVHDELVWEAPAWSADIDWDVTLGELADMAETAHGFDLRVPLVFEPHRGTSWFAAKEGLELPEDMNEPTEGSDE